MLLQYVKYYFRLINNTINQHIWFFWYWYDMIILCMATTVDPWFKLTAFDTDEWLKKAISATVSVMQKRQQTMEGNESPAAMSHNLKAVDLGKVWFDQCCDGWLPEMCRLRNFGSTSRLHLPFCICDYVPVAKNLNFDHAIYSVMVRNSTHFSTICGSCWCISKHRLAPHMHCLLFTWLTCKI